MRLFTTMHRKLAAAQSHLWDSLINFVKQTGSNMEIAQYLVSLSVGKNTTACG